MGHQQTESGESKNEKPKKTVKTVGEVLKQTRESKGYSLQDISEILRVSERYLQALEQEDHDSLPEPVYTLGFLRSYALYLSIDPTPLVAKLQSDLAMQSKQNSFHFRKATPENQIPTKPIVFASAVLAVVVVIGWGYHQIDQSIEKTQTDKLALSPNEKINVSGSHRQAAIDEFVGETTIPTQDELLAQDSQQDQSVFAENVLPEMAKEQLTETSNQHINNVPKVHLADFRVSPGQPLTIKAERRSWVEVRTKDGRILLSRILKEGESRQINVRPGLVFSTGNAGGVVFSTQTQQTMPLGAEGQVVRDIKLQYAAVDPEKLEEDTQHIAQADYDTP